MTVQRFKDVRHTGEHMHVNKITDLDDNTILCVCTYICLCVGVFAAPDSGEVCPHSAQAGAGVIRQTRGHTGGESAGRPSG